MESKVVGSGLRGFAAFAAQATAILGFIACSDSAPSPPEQIGTVQSALSGGTDPVVRYWFNEASGTQANDSSGNGHSATLQNGATFVAGARGNAVRIAGGTQRVALPAGVVQACQDVTIAARVRLTTNSANWARVFDIGNSTTSYLFLTPRAGASNVLRFAITTGGGAAEQQLSYTYSFPTNTWKHVAVVLNGNTGTLYLDGVQVAQNTNLTLNPSALGATANNWLGDSQFTADPTLDGTVDDVLVSCRPYSASEISWLANGTDSQAQYSFNELSGTTAADSSGNARHATLANGASFVSGLHGNAVQIAGGSQRVNIPTAVVQSCTDLTVAGHVRLATNATNWARIFDFGSSTTSYMFLTPRAGASNILRFAITTSGGGAEQRLSYTYSFPTNTWKHVAVVLSGNTGTMYVDGAQVAQNTSLTLNPSALGATANNWLGDSQFSADPTLNGTIDNFLVSCRAFSPSEIGALAGACTSSAQCNDGNSCTTDTCSNGFCSHSNASNGTACLDGNVCNGAESCQGGWCAAGTPPVVDDGDACTADACDPVQGVTHTPITGGGCGGGGSGGSTQGGSGGTGGTGGSAGTSPGGTAGGTPIEFFIELPTGVNAQDVTLATYGGALTMNDGAVLADPVAGGNSSASSVRTTQQTEVGVSAALKNLWSVPNVFLRNNSRVLGDLTTSGTVTLQAGAAILGARNELTSLEPIRRIAWQVVFPSGTLPSVHLEPGQTQTISPGAFDNLEIKSSARLILSSGGRYVARSLVLHPGSVLEIGNGGPAVEIYTRDTLNYSGTIEEHAPERDNVLYAHAGISAVAIERPFRGILVAPSSPVVLASTSQGHDASVFARAVTVHQWTVVRQKRFVPGNFCSKASNECGGLCPCTNGKKCAVDGDCVAGLVCAPGAGPAYGGEPGTGACQPPECKDRAEFNPTLCGTTQDVCGLCNVPPRPCLSTNDCGQGESCTPGNGVFFGFRDVTVCWPTICTTPSRVDHCGSINAACGFCACAANCQGKTCGGDMSNACGGECESVCADRQPGCTMDVHCPQGSVCVLGGGPRVSLAEGINVCLPRVCTDHDLTRVPCGSTGALCGTCPECLPNCEERCGGSDGCGGICPAGCAADEECTADGLCLGSIGTTDAEIPDGLGGTKTVPPVDPGPTSGVGATAGVFGVTETGKATYRIPILVPPGRMGLQPGLSLTYGGTLRNGALGVGWSLEGLSSIARCRHTENRDGYSGPILDKNTDRYCLDGVQLVAGVEEDYGADGAIHFPEFDTRTRVVSHGTGLFGPDWFEVRRSNGLIYTYGRGDRASVFSAPQIKREWALERVEDRVGNYLTISYARFDGFINGKYTGSAQPVRVPTTEMVPSAISYAGFSRPGAPAAKLSRAVTFTYEDRVDQNVAFLAGQATWRTRRLKKIATTIGFRAVRTYGITYGDEIGAPAPNGVSRIARVEECGGDGVCLPPTTFEYFDDAGGDFLPVQSGGVSLRGDVWGAVNNLDNVPGPLVRMRRGAVDDVFYGFHYNVSRENCALGAFLCGLLGEEENEGIPFLSWARIFGGPSLPLRQEDYPYAQEQTQFRELCKAPPSWTAELWPIGDFDLDGHDDLIDLHVLGRTQHRWFPQGSGPSLGLNSHPTFDTCTEGEPLDTQITDVTGDGRPDGVACRDVGVELYKHFGARVLGSPVTLPAPGGDCPMPFIDIDGDGTPNLLSQVYVPTEELEPGEIVPRARVGTVLRYRADTGEGLWDPSALPMNNCRDTASGIACKKVPPLAGVWVDLNGDALKDFVAVKTRFLDFEPSDDSTEAFLNTGRGFVQVHAVVRLKLKQVEKALVIDVNRDGKEELVMPVVDEFFGNAEDVPPNVWRVVGLQGSSLVELHLFDTAVPFGVGFEGITSLVPRHDAVVADVNGDGADDLVMISGPNGNQKVSVLRGRGANRNLLSAVTDGLGKRVEVRWDRGEIGALTYEPAADCGLERCETRPVVVSEHSVWQVQRDNSPPRGERHFTYRYRDGRTNPADGKFLGFAERAIIENRGAGASVGAFLRETVIQVDNSTRFFTGANLSRYGYPLAGRRKLVRVTEPEAQSEIATSVASSRVTETAFDWEPKFGHGGVFADLEARTTIVSELASPGPVPSVMKTIFTVNETFETDEFGNVTNVDRIEQTPDGALASGSTDTIYDPLSSSNLDAWLIALPERRTVTDRVVFTTPVRTETRRTAFTYYPGTNLPHHVTREPSDDNFYLDTEFVRFAEDPYGNVEQVVQTTHGPEPERRSAVTYSGDGTFPSTFTVGKGTDREQTSYVAFDARFGTPILASDPNGIATQWAYDSFGRVTREISPSTESQTDYLIDLPRTSETLPTHAVMAISTETAGYGRSEVGIDAFGRPVRRVTTGLLGEDVLTETLYDDAGLVVGQSRPHAPGVTSQGFVQYDYDQASRLERIIQADSRTIEFEYASRAIVSNVAPELGALPRNYLSFTRTKDPKGNLSLSIADQRGQLAASRDTGGAWVQATPGPFGIVPEVSVAGRTNSYEYDTIGRLTRSVDADRGVERHTYTHFDEPFEYFIGNAPVSSVSYGYDELGRLSTVSLFEGGTATYHYDNDGTGAPNQIGRLVNTTSFDGSRREFAYEPPTATGNRGLLASVTDVVEGATMTTGLEYNGFGQLTRTRYPGATTPFVVDRQYDAGGNVRLVGSEDFTETYWALLSTHQGYMPATESYTGTNASNTSVVGHEYEALTGRVHRITSAPVVGAFFQDVEHQYDANGNLQTRTDKLAPTETAVEQFAYDERDRLTDHYRGQDPIEHIDYTPDGRGNIAELAGLGTYQYDAVPNKPANMPSSAGNINFAFDSRNTGNVARRAAGTSSVQTFSHDSTGQVTRIGVNGIPDAVELKYHASGERASKTTSGGTIPGGRRIRYSGDYERETTAVASDTEHRYRIYTPFGCIGEIVHDNTGTELSRTYWHKDLLGSPEVLTNATGSVIHQQKFSAFGQSDNPTWQSSDPAVRRVRRGYTGHEHDTETGLVNMGARLYDATTARFMAPDPGVQVPSWTQSWNRFSYVWNNPMNWVDPTGLEGSEPGPGEAVGGQEPLIIYPPDSWTPPASEIPGLTGTGVSPIETAAPLTTPGAPGVAPDVRAPAETPGAGTGDEFGPSEREKNWEAAQAGGRNWLLEELEFIGDLLSRNPLNFLRDSGLLALRAQAPTNPGQRAQYDFMRNGLTFLAAAGSLGAGGGGAAAGGGGGGGGGVFYRIITEAGSLRNFASNATKGLAPRGPEIGNALLHRGISVFNSLEGAASRVGVLERGGHRVLGIAELRIPAGARGVDVTKTLGPGHYTMTGSPEAISSNWFFSWTVF